MTPTRTAAALLLLAVAAACTPKEAVETAEAGPAARGAETCAAAAHQSLVGTSVGALDPATLPEPRRVIFPGQAVTMDFRAERLNVEIGSDDKIARVYCG